MAQSGSWEPDSHINVHFPSCYGDSAHGPFEGPKATPRGGGIGMYCDFPPNSGYPEQAALGSRTAIMRRNSWVFDPGITEKEKDWIFNKHLQNILLFYGKPPVRASNEPRLAPARSQASAPPWSQAVLPFKA